MRVTFTSLADIASSSWEQARQALVDDLQRLQSTINRTWDVSHHADGTQKAEARGILLGQISGTLAEQPTGLTIENDGLLMFVSDLGHMVRWNGSLSVWEFAPGDPGNGYFQSFAITPQAAGWALADGSATTYLAVGAPTLTTANITLPNLTGTPAYLKSAAAYTGTINAKAGSTANGGVDHTHNVTGATAGPNASISIQEKLPPDFTELSPSNTHTHNISLTSGGASVVDHAHTVGTIEMAHLGVLPYFRR
jgi:hypothetical protein